MPEEKSKRIGWDEYFLKIAAVTAERSTCLRHHVGAIIVKDRRILSTGYNGAVKGAEDCMELGCIKDELGLKSGIGYETCRAVHAEQNAILQAAKQGVSVEGGTIYCTHTPCRMCSKEIVNAGLKEVVSYQKFSGDNGSKNFLEDCGIKIRILGRPNDKIIFKD